MSGTAATTELGEFCLTIAGRDVTVQHHRAVVSWLDEQQYLSSDEPRQYGTVLWPASIALALEIGQRADEFGGRRVLELGAGVGLSGLAAAAVGASVLQTDRDADALSLCQQNAERNGLLTEQRVADWATNPDLGRFDWVIAADVLYRSTLHEHLKALFDTSLSSNGRLLIADPFRSASVTFLEGLEGEGWRVRMSRWMIGEREGWESRAIGVFELTR